MGRSQSAPSPIQAGSEDGNHGKRADWVDAARGIGIILVVYGHALRGIIAAGITPETAATRLQDAVIYAFHMPLFFLLAGLWVERSLRRGKTKFVLDKVTTVAWPYFLWSAIEGFVALSVGPATNHPLSMQDLLGIAVQPIHHFWFLYALFLCHAAAAVAAGRTVFMLVLAGIFLLVPVGPLGMLAVAATSMPYYVAGILLSRRPSFGDLLHRYKLWLAGGAWLVFAALFIGIRPDVRPPSLPLQLCLGAAGIAGTIALATFAERVKLLVLLGQASMAIYVLHTLFSAGLRIVVVAMVLNPNPVLVLAGVTLAGLVGPTVAWIICDRLRLLKVLGLGPGALAWRREPARSEGRLPI